MKLGPTDLSLRMTVARLAEGGLWVHSPTRISTALREAVADLGEVAHLVAAANGHNLFLMEWRQAFPDATVWVAPGIPKKLPDLGPHSILGPHGDWPWSGEFDQASMPGLSFLDETVFLHRASRSLIVTDLVQNHSEATYEGLGWVIAKLLLEPIGFKGICLAPPTKSRFFREGPRCPSGVRRARRVVGFRAYRRHARRHHRRQSTRNAARSLRAVARLTRAAYSTELAKQTRLSRPRCGA